MADERLDAADNANDAIQDRVIRHMVYLERYKASEVKRIIKVLDTTIIPDLETQIQKRVEAISASPFKGSKAKLAQLEGLKKALERLSDKMSATLKKELSRDLDELALQEAQWQIDSIEDALTTELNMSMPAPALISGLADKFPFAGYTLDDWFKSLSKSQQGNLTKAIQQSIIEGETVSQTMQRVRGTRATGYTDGVLSTTRRQAEAIVRSSVNHVTNQARFKMFSLNKDLFSGLKWTATLDGRTTLICATLDGKVFPVDKGQRPPAHVNCRSTMTPILKSAKELGLKNIPETTRASMNGQVPGNITYQEWLKKQPRAFQESVLGKTKAKLFNEGNLKLEKFSSAKLKPLTLEQLKKTEKSGFKRAKIDV